MNNKNNQQKTNKHTLNMSPTVFYAFCWFEDDKWKTSEHRFHTDTSGSYTDVKMGQFLRDTWFRKNIYADKPNRFAIVSVNLENLSWYGPSISKHISKKLNESPDEFKFPNDHIYTNETGRASCTLKDIWYYEITNKEVITATKDLLQVESHERLYFDNKNHNEIDYKLSFAFNLIKEKPVNDVETDIENYSMFICAPEFSV
jgi:hypothetical protein